LMALTSGADGLTALKLIVKGAPSHLRSGGWLLLEHGYNQAADVCELLRAQGFVRVSSRRDLNGLLRCSGGQMP
jgi:release factor glutamine methyltransferase